MAFGENDDLFGGIEDFDESFADNVTEENAGESDSFESKMEEGLKEMESGTASADDFMNDRLREMNKKLPEWSLEPPFSFLK